MITDGLILPIVTKTGYLGHYSSYLGFTADYDFGFAILAADSTGAADLNPHVGVIGDAMIAAQIKNTAVYTAQMYAGTYTGIDNSSITLVVDGEPGISVSELVNGGKDIRASLAVLSDIDPEGLSFRLFPTNLKAETKTGGEKIALRAVLQDENELADGGTATCISWESVDELVYGGKALDEFVVETDAAGKVVKVEGVGLRMSFMR